MSKARRLAGFRLFFQTVDGFKAGDHLVVDLLILMEVAEEPFPESDVVVNPVQISVQLGLVGIRSAAEDTVDHVIGSGVGQNVVHGHVPGRQIRTGPVVFLAGGHLLGEPGLFVAVCLVGQTVGLVQTVAAAHDEEGFSLDGIDIAPAEPENIGPQLPHRRTVSFDLRIGFQGVEIFVITVEKEDLLGQPRQFLQFFQLAGGRFRVPEDKAKVAGDDELVPGGQPGQRRVIKAGQKTVGIAPNVNHKNTS